MIAFACLVTVSAKDKIQIGTKQVVEDYLASQINRIAFFLKAERDGVSKVYNYPYGVWNGQTPLKDRSEMDQVVITRLTEIMRYFLADTNTALNKSKGIQAYVTCAYVVDRGDYGALSKTAFNTAAYIPIIPTLVNRTYEIPNLSGLISTLKLASDVPYFIPGQKFARLEVGHKGYPLAFRVWDGQIDPSTEILSSDEFMYLPSGIITSSSAADGEYWLRLSITTANTFKVFDGDGNLLPKRPINIECFAKDGSATVYAMGGDSGQGFRLQSTTDYKTWTYCDEMRSFVSPFADYSPKVVSATYVIGMTNNQNFFRVLFVDGAP